MAPSKDDLLARIAVEKGWITEPQLEECRKARFNMPADPEMTIGRVSVKPLGSVMVEKKLLTPDQLTELISESKRRLDALAEYERMSNAEMELGQLLVRHNKATQLQINKCIEIQRKLAEKGTSPVPALKHLIGEHGFVDAATIAGILKLNEKNALTCSNCGREFNVVGVEPGKTYKCRFCGGILMTPKMRDSLKAGGSAPGSGAPTGDPK